MKCAQCGYENGEDARSCNLCHANLAPSAPKKPHPSDQPLEVVIEPLPPSPPQDESGLLGISIACYVVLVGIPVGVGLWLISQVPRHPSGPASMGAGYVVVMAIGLYLLAGALFLAHMITLLYVVNRWRRLERRPDAYARLTQAEGVMGLVGFLVAGGSVVWAFS